MKQRMCSIPSCPRPRHSREWCKRHYERWRTTGDPITPPRSRGVPKREFPDGCVFFADGVRCGKPVVYVRLGLCRGHEKQYEMGKSLTPLRVHRLLVADGRKLCGRCGVMRPVSAFYQLVNGLSSMCRECQGVAHRAYRYGIEFDAMRDLMRQPCAGCGVTDLGGRDLHIDHDHSCCAGKTSCGECVRGVLCVHCNQIVRSHASPALLRRLADYLER